MDLSEYFDDNQAPAAKKGASRQPARQSAKTPRPQTRRDYDERPATPRKSDRGLNIALMVCGILAIAVLTFVLILLLWPRETPVQPQQPQQPTVSSIPVVTQEPQQTVIPAPQTVTPAPPAATDTPVVIITPSPMPSPIPVTPAPATPTPSPAAVAVVTPSPTPAPDYLLPDSDSRYLTEADLKGLSHEQLCFARNEIFARHGRIFKTPQIAAYFNSKSWYKGTVSPDKFNENVLNKYEWANVTFIRDYENKHYGGSYY